ncbi:nuclear movement protein (macronuclear) [Tetrahymena thermophila SB210]|uniref:Nuclear migration protein nudC n=1 Tax=Tetrahymena thermophila (strain SB210) TaxID=312017 RepID=W7XJY1_TETTS|nr:nuclear movement protein [Tetrahymena thermophila SB210]EWS74424.1 nuclear movement protein [Tetrahymena thermophila SB210]|eukprot:XP_012653001.1 nuclear movement protein [Tetrahymena thermophila SB210]
MENFLRFDDYYFTICKETGGIEGVLHSMFNFLFRRTDFFYEADPGDKMGFIPGQSKQLVNKIFDQYQNEHYKRFPPKDPEQYAKKIEEYKKKKEQESKIGEQAVSPQVEKPSENQTSQKKEVNTSQTAKVQTENQEKQIQNQKETNQKPSSNISTYNGGETEKYKWSQSINDITVELRLPRKVKSKELNVEFKVNHLKVTLKPENTVLIDGELYEKIKVEDSLWNIDGDLLQITMEKGIETIWKTIIKGDQEIDATKVENSKPLESFDTETQGALRKIMYEQQRKQMGLPSTEEEQQLEALKKAWNAEGSPFKGQPFDPSKFNIGGGGMNLPPMQ